MNTSILFIRRVLLHHHREISCAGCDVCLRFVWKFNV